MVVDARDSANNGFAFAYYDKTNKFTIYRITNGGTKTTAVKTL